MEVESFEDEGVAKLLNDGFVSIKVRSLNCMSDYFYSEVVLPCCIVRIFVLRVWLIMFTKQVDREERPDVDKV